MTAAYIKFNYVNADGSVDHVKADVGLGLAEGVFAGIESGDQQPILITNVVINEREWARQEFIPARIDGYWVDRQCWAAPSKAYQ